LTIPGFKFPTSQCSTLAAIEMLTISNRHSYPKYASYVRKLLLFVSLLFS
jgi:hypothetical protein